MGEVTGTPLSGLVMRARDNRSWEQEMEHEQWVPLLVVMRAHVHVCSRDSLGWAVNDEVSRVGVY